MFKFFVLTVLCWVGLFVLAVIFISDRRKKALLLRSFVKLAKNQSPEKWTVEDVEGSGFYEIKEQPREYSIEISGFCLRIGRYPRNRTKNGDKITYYCHRMFVSRENRADAMFEGLKIAKTYNQIHQERRKMEKIIEKWQKLGARIRKSDILAPAPA
jgi:hypothetical protein